MNDVNWWYVLGTVAVLILTLALIDMVLTRKFQEEADEERDRW